MACREFHLSPRESNGTIERVYIVEGTTDEVQAKSEATSASPATYRGFIRNPIPDIAPKARGVFEVTFTYQPLGIEDDQESEPQGDLPTLGTLEIDGAGGTRHVTQCLYQTAYPSIAAEIEQKRIVGLHRDGVNGAEIDMAGSTIVLTKKFLPQAVSGAYVKGLLDMRSKVNLNPWTLRWAHRGSIYAIEFPGDELRFLYAKLSTSFTIKGTGVIEISYAMLHSPNRRDVDLTTDSQPIRVAYIGGHDYLWCMYKKTELTGSFKASIEVPEVAFVSTMYEKVDFASQFGF